MTLQRLGVPAKNSIQPAVTEFERHGGTPAGRVRAQPSSLTTGSRDDPRPRWSGPSSAPSSSTQPPSRWRMSSSFIGRPRLRSVLLSWPLHEYRKRRRSFRDRAAPRNGPGPLAGARQRNRPGIAAVDITERQVSRRTQVAAPGCWERRASCGPSDGNQPLARSGRELQNELVLSRCPLPVSLSTMRTTSRTLYVRITCNSPAAATIEVAVTAMSASTARPSRAISTPPPSCC